MKPTEELIKKYVLDSPTVIGHFLTNAYAKDNTDPIVLTHFAHGSQRHSQLSYPKNPPECALFVFLSGECSFIFDQTIYTPSYGEALLVRNLEKYMICFYPNSYLDYYEIDFPLSFFDHLRENNLFSQLFYNRKEGEQNMTAFSPADRDNMVRRLQELESLGSDENEQADLLGYAAIIQIMGMIHTHFTLAQNHLPNRKVPAKLTEAVSYIHQNFLTLLSMEEVAAHCGITNTYLARMFQKHMLCTPNEYVSSLRISHAKYLLKNGATLTEACFQSGFRDYAYFIAKFKKIAGVTPFQFKND